MSQSIPNANSFAYLGVRAVTPPNYWTANRDPNANDYRGYIIGDFWKNKTNLNVWWLVSLAGNQALWILMTTGGVGSLVGLQPQINGVDNGAVVNPVLGIIDINNTDLNIVPSNGGTNHLNLNLANSITIQGNINTVDGNLNIERTTFPGVINLTYKGADTDGGFIQVAKNHGAGNPIVSGDTVGNFVYYGFDGTNYVQAAKIRSVSSGTVAANRVAGSLEFFTHPDAPIVGLGGLQRMSILPSGNIIINDADAGSGLNVLRVLGGAVNGAISAPNGNITTGVGVYVGGDYGGGAAGFTGLTNVSVAAAVGVNTLVGVAGGAVNQGYIKMYLGVVPIYLPYFTNP